jgi:uncharacterized membrane protein
MKLPVPTLRVTGPALMSIPLAAAAVHIVAALMAMNDTANSAYRRLSPGLELHKMVMLQPVTKGHQPIPYMTADARYAMCRFDTSKGPVSVNAVLPDLGWTLGIYRPNGATVYFATAAPGKLNDVSITIVPSEDKFLGLPSLTKKDRAAPESRFSITAREGLIVVRAPEKGLAYRAETEKDLARAACSAHAY